MRRILLLIQEMKRKIFKMTIAGLIACGMTTGIAKWRADCDAQTKLSKIPDIEYRKESAILDKYDAEIAEIDQRLHSESDRTVKSELKAKRKKLASERTGLINRIYKEWRDFSAITEKVKKLSKKWQKKLVKKLPSFSEKEREELQVNFAQKLGYGYVIAKAARYLLDCENSISYAKDDFFHYPMEDCWNMQLVYSACKDLVYELNGLTATDFFTMPPTAIRELYEMMHFTFTDFENTGTDNVYKMNFVHKFTGDKCYAYCGCKDMSILGSYPFYFRVMINDRLKPYGINLQEPVLVTVCEKETVVKIHTDNRICGIAAEYTYAYQKFSGSELIIQVNGKKDIEGNPTEFDVLLLKLPDSTIKEVTFDISDFKNEFEGLENRYNNKTQNN